MDVRKERDVAMRRAYGFARGGNAVWGQLWIDRANSFYAVSPRQLAYANRLLEAARAAKEEDT